MAQRFPAVARSSILAAAASCVALLAGCAAPGTTPRWDARFGDATRAAFAQQVLHPQAGRDTRPVDGMDGQAAVAAQQRYQKSFTEPPAPSSAFTIGVSGAR